MLRRREEKRGRMEEWEKTKVEVEGEVKKTHREQGSGKEGLRGVIIVIL